MSLSSLDGLLPSTFKKLLSGELPKHRSAHLTEAVAAGCGYPNNAAYLEDLRTSTPITFMGVDRVDSQAMAQRLATVVGASTSTVATNAIYGEVVGALERIRDHVVGDIVPVGIKSGLMPDPSKLQALPKKLDVVGDLDLSQPESPKSFRSRQEDAKPLEPNPFEQYVLDHIGVFGTIGRETNYKDAQDHARAGDLIHALVGISLKFSYPRAPYLSDILDLMPIGSVLNMARNPENYDLEHKDVRGLQHYVEGLPGYNRIQGRITDLGVAAVEHKRIANQVRKSIHIAIDYEKMPDGWAGLRKQMLRIGGEPTLTVGWDEVEKRLRRLVTVSSFDVRQHDVDNAVLLASALCSVMKSSRNRNSFGPADLLRAAEYEVLSAFENDAYPEVIEYFRSLREKSDEKVESSYSVHWRLHKLIGIAVEHPGFKAIVPVE